MSFQSDTAVSRNGTSFNASIVEGWDVVGNANSRYGDCEFCLRRYDLLFNRHRVRCRGIPRWSETIDTPTGHRKRVLHDRREDGSQ